MTQAWSIYVELCLRDAPDDLYDGLHEHLAASAPAVGTAPNGNLCVRLFVEAATARQAIDAGLKTVTTAAKTLGVTEPVVGVEVLTEDELDRRNAEPVIPDLVGISEIAEMLSVNRARAGQLSARSDFPPALAHLKAGPVYSKEQVEAFERRWDRHGGRPPKPVELSEVERLLLEKLRGSRNAVVHGDRLSPHQLDELMVQVLRRVDELSEADLDKARRMAANVMKEVLEVKYRSSSDWDAALRGLLRHKLVELRDTAEEGGVTTVDLALTSKGQRVQVLEA
jgi:hypothetical protein